METDYSKIEILFFKVLLTISQINVDGTSLNNLKVFFNDQINSLREFNEIKTIRCLLKILEKRYLIHVYNIEILYDFLPYLNNENLIIVFDEYNKKLASYLELEPIRQTNYYRQERLNAQIPNVHVSQNEPSVSNITQNVEATPILSESPLKIKMYNTIAREIGKHWSDFARELKIREGEIDNIRAKNCYNIKDAVYAVLSLYEERSMDNKNYFYFNILNALTNCRRNDLRKEIEKYVPIS